VLQSTILCKKNGKICSNITMVEAQTWTPLKNYTMWQHFWPPHSVLSPKDTNVKKKRLNQKKFTIAMTTDFPWLEGQSLAKKSFYCSSSFLKGTLTTKNLNITLFNALTFFLLVAFQEFLLLDHSPPPQTFWQLKHHLHQRDFINCYTICFIICYKIIFVFYVCIKSMHKINVTKQAYYDLKISNINIFLIIHKK
jgi:hypothetical protein